MLGLRRHIPFVPMQGVAGMVPEYGGKDTLNSVLAVCLTC